VDNAGHSSYWGSDKYYRFLKLVDGLVKNIHGALQEKMLSTETLIVITSDHGGYGSGHTEWMRPTAQVPVIFFSPSRSMKKPGKKGWGGWLDIKDVAPTVLGAMGIRAYEWPQRRLNDAHPTDSLEVGSRSDAQRLAPEI
ncbi:hypothetical protein FOZ63_009258, partial [Perkinsus olseni]